MKIDPQWLMTAPAKDIAERALGSLASHCNDDAERLEMMTSIITAIREASRAEAVERLAELVPSLFAPEKPH